MKADSKKKRLWNKYILFHVTKTKRMYVLLPVAEQKQTENKASGKGNRNPDIMDRKIEPGIAKVWK